MLKLKVQSIFFHIYSEEEKKTLPKIYVGVKRTNYVISQ